MDKLGLIFYTKKIKKNFKKNEKNSWLFKFVAYNSVSTWKVRVLTIKIKEC